MDIDVTKINQELSKEREQFEDMGGQARSINDIGELLGELSTSFDQNMYISIINRYIKQGGKAMKQKKHDGYDVCFVGVYQILMMGYHEVDRGNEDQPEVLLPIQIFKDTENNEKVFIKAARILFKDLDKRMDSLVGKPTTPKTLSMRNTLQHILVNAVKVMAITFGSEDLIMSVLDGFDRLGISDDTGATPDILPPEPVEKLDGRYTTDLENTSV